MPGHSNTPRRATRDAVVYLWLYDPGMRMWKYPSSLLSELKARLDRTEIALTKAMQALSEARVRESQARSAYHRAFVSYQRAMLRLKHRRDGSEGG